MFYLSVYTACGDGFARVYDAKSGALKRTFKGHEGAVYSILVRTFMFYIMIILLAITIIIIIKTLITIIVTMIIMIVILIIVMIILKEHKTLEAVKKSH